MLVIQMIGKYKGQTVDLPPPIAKSAVKEGRAKPLPGEGWRFGLKEPEIETAVLDHQETTELVIDKAVVSPNEMRCPHCGTTGKHAGMMKRWHFDNCKSKQNA